MASILTDTATTIPGLIAMLNDVSEAEVKAQVATALTDIHLDHVLAVTYDPASKPGVADALLNELIESDGGVSRFTANALEQAPGGGGGGDATAANQTIIIGHLTDIKGAGWASGTDTLEAIADAIQTVITTGGTGPWGGWVLPVNAQVPERNKGSKIEVFTNEAVALVVPVYDADGDPVDLDGETLNLTAWDQTRNELLSVTATGTTTGFNATIPKLATQLIGTWAVRTTDANTTVITQGVFEVKSAPLTT